MIYVLPGDKFQERGDQWVSSSKIERSIQEIHISDAKDYLQKLTSERNLKILYYPEKGNYFPGTPEDLVMKAALSYQQSGEKFF